MTAQEKLDLMEQLWADLTADGNWESPEWHGVILAERLKGIEAGTAEILELDEAWAELDRECDQGGMRARFIRGGAQR